MYEIPNLDINQIEVTAQEGCIDILDKLFENTKWTITSSDNNKRLYECLSEEDAVYSTVVLMKNYKNLFGTGSEGYVKACESIKSMFFCLNKGETKDFLLKMSLKKENEVVSLDLMH